MNNAAETDTTQQDVVDETQPEQQVQAESTGAGADEATETQGQQEKTYTQAEVDRLIGIQKAKLPDKAEWQEFEAWKAKQRPPDQELSKTERDLQAALAQLEEYKAREERSKHVAKVKSSGVQDDFADYATYEIEKLTSDTKDFDTAMQEWIAAHEHFTRKPLATGFRRGSSPAEDEDGVEKRFYELNPGLKPKPKS